MCDLIIYQARIVPSKDEEISIRICCKMSERKEVGYRFKVTLTPRPNLCLMVVAFSFNCVLIEGLLNLYQPCMARFSQFLTEPKFVIKFGVFLRLRTSTKPFGSPWWEI